MSVMNCEWCQWNVIVYYYFIYIIYMYIQEAKRKAEEEETNKLVQLAQQKKAEKEARKLAKYQARLAQLELERKQLENKVFQDVWTQEQQLALESALLKFNWFMDRTERWNNIMKSIPPSKVSNDEENNSNSNGESTLIFKTRNQCIRRYKYLKTLANSLLPSDK